jgi:hypothetical protein
MDLSCVQLDLSIADQVPAKKLLGEAKNYKNTSRKIKKRNNTSGKM